MRRRTFCGWGVGRKWNYASGDDQPDLIIREESYFYRENPFTENDDIHVQWLEVSRTIGILVETPEADEIVRPEELNLLARFFHLDIFRCQRVNAKDLFARN
jgi:hypothetical protein